MNDEDLPRFIAAIGIFLRASGVAGSVPLEAPTLGEAIDLPTRLSLQLSGTGAAILISVAVVGWLLKGE